MKGKREKGKKARKPDNQNPLAQLFGGIKPVSGPFDRTAMKKIQEHLYDGPLEERTEFHNPEFNAIVFLKVLADGYDCNIARVILDAISQCRISLERKGRMEDVQAIQTEVQRQLEQSKLEIERMRATTGDRR